MGTAGALSRRAGGWLRAFAGVLAGGLVVLVVVLAVGWFAADRAGTPGPGPGTLSWHGAAAVAAVLTQRYADRRAGATGAAAALGVCVITAAVLAAQWLA